MPQLAELLVGIEVDSKSAQADLLKLEQQLGVTATRAGAAGQRIDDGFAAGVERSVRRAGGEFRQFGATAESALRQAAASQATLGARTAESTAKSTQAAAKLRAEYESQRAVLDRNVIGLDRLEGGYKKNARALDQMERQAKEARATLERMFRTGAIDAKEFQQQLHIVENSMQEFRRASGAAGNKTLGQELGGLALKIGAAVVAYQALASAARGATRFVLGSIEAAQVQEDAENALAAALERTGSASVELQERLKGQAAELQRNSRFGDETLIRMQALGLSMGVSSTQIEQATQAAADMSAALGMDLQSAMRNVAKTTGGYAGELGELIPELKDLTKEQLQAGEGIDLLARKFGGAAARDVETFSGRVDQLKNAWGDAREEFGEAITDNEDLKTAMGNLAAILPGLGTKLADLAGELAPAAARAVELADGIIGIVTASNQIDTGNLRGIGVELGKAQQEVIDLEDKLRGLKKTAQQRSGGGGGLVGDVGGSIRPGVVDDVTRELEAARKKEAELREELVRTRDERKKAAEEAIEQARKEAEARRKAEQEARRQAQAQGELEEAQKAAAEAARRQREEIEGVTAQATRYADLAEQVGTVRDTTGEQLELLETLAQGAESAEAALLRLWTENKIEAEEYNALLRDIQEEQQRIADQKSAVIAGDRQGLVDSLTGDMEGPELRRTEGGSLGGGDEDFLASELAAGEEGSPTEAAIAEAEALANLVMQYGELDMARQQLAISQEEATLRADMERMAIDGLTAAEEREIATRMRSIEAMKQDVKASTHAANVKKQLGQVAKQTASSVLNAAIASSAASWKQLEEEMKSKAKGEAVNAIIELAMAAGAYARGDAASGTLHMQSAGQHAAAAAMAGGTAVLAGAMGGGGEGKDSEHAPKDSPGMDTYRDVRESEREERGPRYEVAITGTLLGGQPQDMARQISSYLSQFNEETGDRAGSVRG